MPGSLKQTNSHHGIVVATMSQRRELVYWPDFAMKTDMANNMFIMTEHPK